MSETHGGEDATTQQDDASEATGFVLNRRAMLAGSAGAAAAAWVVPSVVSMSAASAASAGLEGCFPFTQDLNGWTGSGTWNFHEGRGSLQPGVGTGGVIFSPFVATNGVTELTVDVDYSSNGGCGFFGLNCYSNANGTGFLGEIWIFGASTDQAQWGHLEVMTSGVVPGWEAYSATFTLLAGTNSVTLKAENFALEPTPTAPSFFSNACYSG